MIESDGTIIPESAMGTIVAAGPGGVSIVMRREILTLSPDGGLVGSYRNIEGFTMPLNLAEGLCQQLAEVLGLAVSNPERN